jgi:site-specific DNA recombinase
MTSAAIYARVSSARQAKDETIGSQLAALREHAAASRLDVPEDRVFADEGHSGATLIRPGLEALRDLAAQGCLDVVLVYSPDRLARYAGEGAAIADLRRWLTDQGVRTRTGKERWDRPVIWGMLRNPAYCGKAVFGKTQAVHEPAGLNRTARLAGRTVPRQVRVQDRPRDERTGTPHPALAGEETFDRVQQRLADNKRFAARNTTVPSLLQGLAACSSCGYGYYRTSTTTSAGKKIYYYRCLGSDDYRYPGGRVCGNKPVRADYADAVVWDHVTALLADPALIRAEISRRLERARTSDPVTKNRGQLEQALAKTSKSISAMVTAFSEQLITIDELRARMPALRARETSLKDQIATLDARAADRDAYLKLAGDLEGFLTRLRQNSATASTGDRQRVLRAVVQDILTGPEKLTIRHRIPVREPSTGGGRHDTIDTEGDMRESSLLRWGASQARGRCVSSRRRGR